MSGRHLRRWKVVCRARDLIEHCRGGPAPGGTVAVPITGTGFKDQRYLPTKHGRVVEVEPDVSAVADQLRAGEADS